MFKRHAMMPILACALTTLLAACGGSGGSSDGTPTVTATTAPASPTRTPTQSNPSATPSRTPTPGSGSAVRGVIVINDTVSATTGDALGAPPVGTAPASFDRALSHADWAVAGVTEKIGVTEADGRFEITGLAAGRYSLQVTKTLDGNLAFFTVPFAVGDGGRADVVAEVSWGQVRAVSTFTEEGVTVREVRAPNGAWLVTRAGRVSELGDPTNTFIDPDGDGRFDGGPCVEQVWECGADRACGPDRSCACTASCPLCEDCGPAVCAPPIKGTPYRCNDDGTCAQPSDRCVCVSSCPDCDDCGRQVCIPSCDPIEITAIGIYGGPSQLVAGQEGSLYAAARLSNGIQIDVTHLVGWESSDTAVATIDAWGRIATHAIGITSVTATLGNLVSPTWPLEVIARPALRRIYVQNVSCYYPLGRPELDGTVPPPTTRPPTGDILPVPSCHEVVQVGRQIQFQALGEFDNGYYQDLTNEVAWTVTPSAVGTVTNGLFIAVQAGTGVLTAKLEGVTSDPITLRVVTEPTIIGLSIYADRGGFPVRLGRPDGAAPDFCPDCGYTLTLLRGDQLRFHATAQYDTGDWRDVTAEVTWRSSNLAAATIDAAGVMQAVEGGDARINATLAEVISNPVEVRVVNTATLQSLYIYPEGTDRVAAKGEQVYFHANGYYDVGFDRDVTTEATWRSSDEAIGGFNTPGVFTGRSAGVVNVWAELGGQQSAPLSLEVFERSELEYCDPTHVNRAVWADDFNRVVLESDCREYDHPAVVALRYTVTETQPHGGVFDPCLDLYVLQGSRRIRTLREEGCGDPFLPSAAPGRDEALVKYQLRAFWDLKDDTGAPVPPGVYTVYGRFYLYYDPVVSIQVIVGGGGDVLQCIPNNCGNGCGYVYACGDSGPPLTCPTVCTPLCECPAGWGIRADGTCERCTNECCPVGALCGPLNLPPCEPQCCPPNALCADGIAPCDLTLPDLVPVAIDGPHCSLADCAPRNVTGVCVANEGRGSAGPFVVTVNDLVAVHFTGLAGGARSCAEIPFANPATVTVDAKQQVAEQREDNNVRTFTVPTPVPTACDFIAPNCGPTPASR